MKSVLYVGVLMAIFAFRDFDDIYSITVRSMDGQKIELSAFKGKKMLFVICPLSATDTTLNVQELAALQSKYENTLAVIGIIAEETGYKRSDSTSIRKLYKDQRSNFILTGGMKVKKAAGTEQASLFQWLTSKTKNSHFNQDAQGIGQKFFVDEQGELYAVLGPQVKLSSSLIERVVNRQMPKKPINQQKP